MMAQMCDVTGPRRRPPRGHRRRSVKALVVVVAVVVATECAEARIPKRSRAEWDAAASAWSRSSFVAPVLAELSRSVAAVATRSPASAVRVVRALFARSPQLIIIRAASSIACILNEIEAKQSKAHTPLRVIELFSYGVCLRCRFFEEESHPLGPEAAVLVFEGRVIVDERFLHKEKNRKHALFVASLVDKGMRVPNVAYAYSGNSSGLCLAGEPPLLEVLPDDDPKDTDVVIPACLVIAKRDGYESSRGILIPNPYFHDLDFWDAVRASMRKAASQRPFETRVKKAFWRGHVGNAFSLRPPEDPVAEKCADDVGNFARLQAVTVSRQRPDLIDARCWRLDKCLDVRDDQSQSCSGLEYDEEMRRSKNDPTSITSPRGHVPKENFTLYQFVLNLPGSTQGSYSRNLNHLWFLGSVVLLWQSPHKEWYYPALRDGATHRDVNRSTVVSVVQALASSNHDDDHHDKAVVAKLLKGAKTVDATLLCPECLAFYYLAVVKLLRFVLRGQQRTSASTLGTAVPLTKRRHTKNNRHHHHLGGGGAREGEEEEGEDEDDRENNPLLFDLAHTWSDHDRMVLTDLDDVCALRHIFATDTAFVDVCAGLNLVQVLPSKRGLSKFDMETTPDAASSSSPGNAKKKKHTRQAASDSPQNSHSHRRLSTAAQVQKLTPHSCEALATFAAESCQAERGDGTLLLQEEEESSRQHG